jgi:alpha-tubulin suppressor-like RCC1 family protein
MNIAHKFLMAVAVLGLLATAGCKQPLDLSMQRNRIFLMGRLLVGQTCDVRVIWRKAPEDPAPVTVTADLTEIGGPAEQELLTTDNGTWRWIGQVNPENPGEKLITITAAGAQGQQKEESKRFRVFNTDKAIAIACGSSQGLALKADGTVADWQKYLGDLQDPYYAPDNLSEIVAIAGDEKHNLALKLDGTVVSWGLQYEVDMIGPVPEGLSDVVAIAVGGLLNLALKADGRVVGWGYDTASICCFNPSGLLDVPEDLADVVAVSAGSNFALALKADGTVTAWGIGAGVPETLKDVVAVDAGVGSYLALKQDGTVFFGDQSGRSRKLPARAGDLRATAVASGFQHWMALCEDGTVMIWWLAVDGVYVSTFYYVSDERLNNVIALAQGGGENITMHYPRHSMALTDDGSVLAWEEYWDGQKELPVPEGLQ